MRVISGSAKGRPLRAPLPSGVRPTTDRVKESIFDVLGSLGGVVGLDVLDLFCGSGALGIEALSRGAQSVTFVDSDPRSIAAARANVEAVGLDAAACRFVTGSAIVAASTPVDLVLMDPPYDMTELGAIFEQLDAATVVVESREPVGEQPGWATTRERRYGGTLVTVLSTPEISEDDR